MRGISYPTHGIFNFNLKILLLAHRIPLPASTQWEIVEKVAGVAKPAIEG